MARVRQASDPWPGFSNLTPEDNRGGGVNVIISLLHTLTFNTNYLANIYYKVSYAIYN